MANIKTDSRLALQRALEQQLGRTPRTLEQQLAGTRPRPAPVQYPSAAGIEVRETGLSKPASTAPAAKPSTYAPKNRSLPAAAAQPPALGSAANPIVNDASKVAPKAPGAAVKARSVLKAAAPVALGMAAYDVANTPTSQYSTAAGDALLGKPDANTSSGGLLVRDIINRGVGAVGQVLQEGTLGLVDNPFKKPAPAQPAQAAKPAPAAAKPAAAQATKPAPAATAPAPFDPMRPAGTGLTARTLLAGGGDNGEDVTVQNSELESKTGGKMVADGILRVGNTFTNVVDGNRIGQPVGAPAPGQKDNVVEMVERVAARDARINSAPMLNATVGGGSSQSTGNGVIDYFRQAGERRQQRAMQLQDSQNSAAMARQEANDRTQREVAGMNNEQAMARTLLQEQGENQRAQTAAAAKNQLSASDLLAAQREQRQVAQDNQTANLAQLQSRYISEDDKDGKVGAARAQALIDRTAIAMGLQGGGLQQDPQTMAQFLQAIELSDKVMANRAMYNRVSSAAPNDLLAFMPNRGGKAGYMVDPQNSSMVVGRDALGNEIWRAPVATLQSTNPSILENLFNFQWGEKQAPYAAN